MTVAQLRPVGAEDGPDVRGPVYRKPEELAEMILSIATGDIGAIPRNEREDYMRMVGRAMRRSFLRRWPISEAIGTIVAVAQGLMVGGAEDGGGW